MRKLKSTKKGPLFDGKTLGGKGRLTNKMIHKLQSYFRIGIRQSTGKTVFEMKKAVLFHCSEASNLKLTNKTTLQHKKTNQGTN